MLMLWVWWMLEDLASHKDAKNYYEYPKYLPLWSGYFTLPCRHCSWRNTIFTVCEIDPAVFVVEWKRPAVGRDHPRNLPPMISHFDVIILPLFWLSQEFHRKCDSDCYYSTHPVLAQHTRRCTHMCVCLSVYVHICDSLCVCVCICVCVRACASVRVHMLWADIDGGERHY